MQIAKLCKSWLLARTVGLRSCAHAELRLGFLAVLGMACVFPSAGPLAAEGGSGVYLLGLRSNAAGVTPPAGLFFSNQVYSYSGSIAGSVELGGGRLAADVDANVLVNIPTVVWVTPARFMGGQLGFSATTPFGRTGVSGVVSPFNISASDSVTTFGDPALSAFLGWRNGDLHIQSGVTTYLPIGDYRSGELANVARHRLAADFYTAVTWLNPDWGLDISNTVGLTFNAENQSTGYKTGTEFHWEGALTKQLEHGVSLGVVGYYYTQLTADRPPARIAPVLGDFKSQVAAIGAQVGYNFNIGEIPVATRLSYYHQFDSKNHL